MLATVQGVPWTWLPLTSLRFANEPAHMEGAMTDDRSIDELGPVDYLIVEFPAGAQNFTGRRRRRAAQAP